MTVSLDDLVPRCKKVSRRTDNTWGRRAEQSLEGWWWILTEVSGVSIFSQRTSWLNFTTAITARLSQAQRVHGAFYTAHVRWLICKANSAEVCTHSEKKQVWQAPHVSLSKQLQNSSTFPVSTVYNPGSFFPTCHDVTVSLTHADLPDRKNKSRLLHDVTPQGRVCTCKWQTSLVQNVCSSYTIWSVEKAEAVGV